MIGIYVGATDSRSEIFVEECINLSCMLKDMKQDVLYILNTDMYEDILRNEGYSYIILNSLDMVSELVKLIMKNNISSFIVDSSAVSPDDIESLSVYSKIIAFDDGKLPQNLTCIINYNPFVSWNEYILNYCNGDTRLFLGGDFAPIGNEFSDVKQVSVEKYDKVKDILVYTGRYDRYGVGYALVSKMSQMHELSECRIHTIIGKGYNSFDAYYKLQEKSEGKVIVHTYDENAAMIITSCDIAVSTGVLQIMELAACGIPSVVYSTIEGQSEFIRQMIVKEYAVGVGDIWVSMELKIDSIIDNVITLISDNKKRINLSENIKTLTDGKGIERIVNSIVM